MTIAIIDRDAVVDALGSQFEEIAALCAELTEDQWLTPTCLPGWTVKDNVAHMAGTERMLLGEPTPEVPVDHLEHVRNDIARINEAWVESMRALAGAEVLAELRRATAARMEALGAMSQAQFDEPSWTPAGHATYGRFMRIRVFDCHLHEQDVREALGLPLRTEGVQLQLALDEAGTGLGFIAGKRAALPQGTGLRIELSEPERVFEVDVAERATVVDSLGRSADVELRLPATTFLRLIGGRGDLGDPSTVGVEVAGETELAERLVGALAFTV